MKKTYTLTLLFFMLIAGFHIQSAAKGSDAITSDLSYQLETAAPDDLIRVNITLAERLNTNAMLAAVRYMDKEARRKHVIQSLKDFTSSSQAGVLAELNTFQESNGVKGIKSYWVANVIHCLATPAAIEVLSHRSDVRSIDYDEIREVIDPNENKGAYAAGAPESKEITWNVMKINADEVWALGFDGTGIIVSVIDTGVNYDHLDLEDHMWESEEYPNHGYDFFYNDDDPKDEHGHGTHCAGTVAGDGTAGSQTGVAPEATIMACKVGDAVGSSSESMIWAAVEFSIEQGAHVISLSMGWQHSWGPNRTVWRETFDAVLAAGIPASVAAGNEGSDQGSYPIPDNVRCPGDCPPPWLNPDQTLSGGTSGVICVGSTTQSDGVSSFSSRGPVTWELISPYFDYEYNPEIGLIRPDIAAPGSNIKSLAHYSNTGYEAGWSGTSMATPANAGMIALMLQKNNTLTPEQISQTIEETALVLVAGKNNNSGAGRIDALAAVEASSFPGPSYYEHSLNDASGNNDGLMNPGESILLNLSIANFSEETAEDITVTLSTDSPYITITDSTEYFGDFSIEDIIEMTDAFAFMVAENIPGGEMVDFTITAANEVQSWESGFNEMGHAINLVMVGVTVEDPDGNNNGGLDPGETADLFIEIENVGQLVADGTMAYLNSLNGLLTVNNASFDLESIEAGESAVAVFNVTVNEVAPNGISVEFLFEVSSGSFSLQTSMFVKVGAIVEDFETGDFSQYDWEFDGNQDWEITDEAYEGEWAAVSGDISNSQTSELALNYEVGGNDSIAFFRKVSTEASYDFLKFYIDDDMMGQWSGELGWERFAYPVAEGIHNFRWVFEKDGSVSSGTDNAIIDFIELPAGVDESLAAFAGIDEMVCEGMPFQTSAFAQNYNALLWATSGTGAFDDENELAAIYTPSEDDYAAGMVTLSLTVYASGQEPVSDTMELSFDALPQAAGAIAGEDEVCNGTSETYEVDEITGSDLYSWVLSPEEAGTISGEGNMITIDWEDEYIGEATLKVQGVNDCGGGDYSEELMIMVDECSGVEDMIKRAFTITPNPNTGVFVLDLENTPKAGSSVKLVNLTGEVVWESSNLNSSHMKIDAGDVETGVYFLIVENNTDRMIEKVVIQK